MVLVVAVVVMCGVSFGEQPDGKKKVKLPAVVKTVIEAICPEGRIGELDIEDVVTRIFSVELKDGEKECSIEVAEDGTVLAVESEIEAGALPDAVARAIKAKAGGAKLKKLEKEEIRAVVKVIKLEKPQTVYTAEFAREGRVFEIKVAASGKVLAVVGEGEEDGDDADAEGDDDKKATDDEDEGDDDKKAADDEDEDEGGDEQGDDDADDEDEDEGDDEGDDDQDADDDEGDEDEGDDDEEDQDEEGDEDEGDGDEDKDEKGGK